MHGVLQDPKIILTVHRSTYCTRRISLPLASIKNMFLRLFQDMRNSFNLMLITLALFDSGYLIGSILESFRLSFNLATRDKYCKTFGPHWVIKRNYLKQWINIYCTNRQKNKSETNCLSCNLIRLFKSFKSSPLWSKTFCNIDSRPHLLLFPQFLYPGQAIMMSGSIFMVRL